MSIPIPLPGETAGSFLTRVILRSGDRSSQTALKRMNIYQRQSLHSPYGTGIGKLYQALPELRGVLSPQEFVWRHTIAPLLLAYSSEYATPAQKNAFCDDAVGRGSWEASPRTSYPLKPKGLRFCESCRREDEQHFGVAYWHREHQIRPATCCWKHRTFLTEYLPALGVGLELELPGYGRYAVQARPVAIPRVAKAGLEEWIASAFVDVLDSPDVPQLEDLRAALMRRAEAAALTWHHVPRRRAFWTLMLQTYSTEFLSALGYPTTFSDHIAARYVRPLRTVVDHPPDPVLTVLVAGALGAPVKWLTRPPSPAGTAEKKPMPRRRDVVLEQALHEGGFVIHRAMLALKISRLEVIKRILRAGIRCPVVFGHPATHSEEVIRDMIKMLRRGVPRQRVRSQYGCTAAFLNQLAIYDPALRSDMQRFRHEKLRRKHRRALERFIGKAGATRKGVWEDLRGPISFLHRCDRDWLRTQLARLPKQKSVGPGPLTGRNRVNDGDLDAKIVGQLRNAIPIMQSLVPPRRLNQTLAFRVVGISLSSVWPRMHAGKLPMTQKLCEELTEPKERFRLRRLEHGFAQLKQSRDNVTLSRLARSSGLSSKVIREHCSEVRRLAAEYGMAIGPMTANALAASINGRRSTNGQICGSPGGNDQ